MNKYLTQKKYGNGDIISILVNDLYKEYKYNNILFIRTSSTGMWLDKLLLNNKVTRVLYKVEKVETQFTSHKSTKIINNISDSISNYELEIDITFKKSISETKLSEIINKLGDSIIILEKFLQESQLLITKSEQINVIKNLNKLAYEDENESYMKASAEMRVGSNPTPCIFFIT